jgi:putative transposase
VAHVRRILGLTAGWAPSDRTLQRLFERPRAERPGPGTGRAGRFECTRPNEVWTGDSLHGAVIRHPRSW